MSIKWYEWRIAKDVWPQDGGCRRQSWRSNYFDGPKGTGKTDINDHALNFWTAVRYADRRLYIDHPCSVSASALDMRSGTQTRLYILFHFFKQYLFTAGGFLCLVSSYTGDDWLAWHSNMAFRLTLFYFHKSSRLNLIIQSSEIQKTRHTTESVVATNVARP